VKPSFSRVSVVGLGYVGLPVAAVLASRGVEVIGVDVNERAVALINQGKAHIIEPDLDIIVNAAVATGKLRAVTRPEPADAFIIAVPTPFTEGHRPDLSYLKAAVDAVAPVLKKGDLVILESTSPVGTTEAMAAQLAALRPDLRFPHIAADEADIQVAHSPERVLPGRVLLELVQNDRVVGGLSSRCAERAAALYKLFVTGECLLADARTAELVKLAENSYRDVNIAFANELSLVCDRLGIDVWRVIQLANRHPRVGILKPGPGVGGHCIAVDPWFIVDSAPHETPLIQTARSVNDSKPHHVAEKVRAAVSGLVDPAVACLGLAYKADIDDLRESPAVEVVRLLAGMGLGSLLVVEPHVSELPAPLAGLTGVRLTGLEEALAVARAVVLLADHQPFRVLDRKLLAGKAIIDTRGAWR
jgi:UDP-N-acetyl-D-mannosaminuronic acid dehydrogenase